MAQKNTPHETLVVDTSEDEMGAATVAGVAGVRITSACDAPAKAAAANFLEAACRACDPLA
jgi:hypothetical protein